jgi:acetyl esterase/lipase
MRTDRRTVLCAGAAAVAAAFGRPAAAAAQAPPAPGRPAGPQAPVPAGARIFRVWPGAAPGGERVTVKPTITERSTDPALHDRIWMGVTDPSLTVYVPAKPDGSAVLVIPGGAYQRVVIDKEGEDSARMLNASGITAAVLTYRLPGDGWAAGLDAPLQDAQRAMRLLRSGIAGTLDPNRIGVMGYSAGGDLAASVTLCPDVKTYDPVDDADKLSARPSFAALMYAAVDMPGRRPDGTMGGRDVPLMTRINASTPPCFLIHAADDGSVPVETSLRVFAALKGAKVPAELHVFEEGGHGFGVRLTAGKPVQAWPQLFVAWGARHGFFTGARG